MIKNKEEKEYDFLGEYKIENFTYKIYIPKEKDTDEDIEMFYQELAELIVDNYKYNNGSH